MDFNDRKESLQILGKLWDKKSAEFCVVYGRRRVGKTALLAHFAQHKKLLHWIAYKTTSSELLADFSKQLYTYLNHGETPAHDFSYGSWQVAFDALSVASQKTRLGLIIDEFPYLVESDPSFPSLLQVLWDKKLSTTSLFLALSGSRVSLIKREVLDPKGPLYGRATATLLLEPIPLSELAVFFPKYSTVQLLEVYGITGGVPKYFELIDEHRPVLKNIEQTIRDKTTMLTSEIYFLLHEEFREIRAYLALLRAMGQQACTLNELSTFSGLENKIISKYLDDLVQLKIIERQVPAGEDSQKSRRGRYALRDLFLRFYFHFIAPFLQDIDKARFEGVLENLHQQFNAYMGKTVFERVCQEHLAQLGDQGRLSFSPTVVGAYWDKDCQIDILGLSHHDRVMIAGEAKWTNKKMGLPILKELMFKVKRLARKYDYFCHLALFSRSGFSDDLVDTAKKQNVLLFSFNDIGLPKTAL